MQLRTRITLLVVLVALGLLMACTGAVWLRDRDLRSRYHEALLRTQRVAWTKIESEALAELREGSARLMAQPAWSKAWREQNRPAMTALLNALLREHPEWRADVYDARRRLVYTSATDFRRDSLIETGWISRTLDGADGANGVDGAKETDGPQGLSQVSRDQYHWVVSHRIGASERVGVLALGLDAAARLGPLAQMLQGESFLLNLRGREVAGTQPGLLAREGIVPAVRQAAVTAFEGMSRGVSDDTAGRHWLAGVLPLQGPGGRQIGALLALRDASDQYLADRRMAWCSVAGGLLLLMGLGGLVFTYLRGAMQPLERAVGVLGALAQGDLRAAPDDADEAKADEAGRIARGVAALRGEMLNLQMLREERIRTRQQQERLIRNQLMRLAESLDDVSRTDILLALDPDARGVGHADGGGPEPRQTDNELAELASILGRMSGLVTSQQGRLVQLLRELQAAMQQQALLVSLQQELEIARSMQLSILPRGAPATPAVQVSALMVPAKEIGGDFYDYFAIDAQRLALVVADVSGKGVPAAFFMAISRTLLKSNALLLQRPADVIARLNDQLCAENEQMMFVTVFFGILDLHSGELVFVNAGHNPPLRHSGADGTISLLSGSRNMALAVLEEQAFNEGRIRLDAGDTLLLYTDGVTEATNHGGQLFGEAALVQVVHEAAQRTAPWPDAVLGAVRLFEDGAAQADDITCVAVRYRGAA